MSEIDCGSGYRLLAADEFPCEGDENSADGGKTWNALEYNMYSCAGDHLHCCGYFRRKSPKPESLWPKDFTICSRCGIDLLSPNHSAECIRALIGSQWVYFKDRRPKEKDFPLVAHWFNGHESDAVAFTTVNNSGWHNCYIAWRPIGPLPKPPEPEKTPFEKTLGAYWKSSGPTVHGPFWSEEQLKHFFDAGYAAGREAK